MTTLSPPASAAAPAVSVTADVYDTLIKLAGRQRMLSQRIALFALLALRGDGSALPEAQDALILFRTSHAMLTKGRDGLPAPFNDELRRAFFGQQGADAPITAFIRIAEETLVDIARHTPTAARRVQTLVAQATPMLSLLNRVTQTYEQQARALAQDEREQHSALIGRIQHIAGEARLMSLNARVAATRAGQHGREFASVAGVLTGISEQIEKLAGAAAAKA
jgi:hypothetical protein